MSEELKPCPFCGGSNVELTEFAKLGSESRWHRVSCLDCEMFGPATQGCSLNYWGADTIEKVAQEAAVAWNTRARSHP
jgi:Lar family restriction alleviation protein